MRKEDNKLKRTERGIQRMERQFLNEKKRQILKKKTTVLQ
jgi:hypothetical protein